MVFKKILVAIDRSPQAQVVFEQALELAQKEESTLMVFHCVSWESVVQVEPFIGTLVDVDMSGTFHRLQRERVQKDIEQARDWLATCCQQATSKDIPTEFDCKTGDPNLKICELARVWGADLIVLGRRGHKGLSEMLLGSVSNDETINSTVITTIEDAKIPTPPNVNTNMNNPDVSFLMAAFI